MCNVLRNFMQSLAHKGVYNDLLQPCFLTFRTYAGRVYRPIPWASRTLILLVTYNRGYFQTIRIYDFRILGIADTPHTPTTQYSPNIHSISIISLSIAPVTPYPPLLLLYPNYHHYLHTHSRPFSPYIIYPYISFCPLYLYLLFLNPYVHINPQFFISHHFTVSYLLTPTIYNYI